MKGALVVDCGDYSDNSFFFKSFPQFYRSVLDSEILGAVQKSLISSRSVISAFLTCASAALLLSSFCSSQVSP